MPDTLWMQPVSMRDAQPSKKRRITVDDLTLDLMRLSLSEKASVAAELPTLLRSLSLGGAPKLAASDCGPTMPREVESHRIKEFIACAPTPAKACASGMRGVLGESTQGNIMKEILREHEKAVCRAAGGDADETHAPVQCTAIVPFQTPARQSRWRRIPRITPIPLSMPMPSIAKFAVDSMGTAFVIYPDAVRSKLSRTHDQWKRSYVEENSNESTVAIVIYQKPRKHDLVEDFMTLKL